MSAQPAMLISARGLKKHFRTGGGLFRKAGTIRAVDGVDLDIARGETFALVGESGCGKSTLARLLLRLIEPTAGDVIFDGANLTALPLEDVRKARRHMQIVFQDPFSSLNPRMTVGDLVAEPLKVHGLASGAALKKQVGELLSRVGLLPEHAGRYPHEFSGGQRQRIGIARALACGPKLLVGDEPVSALDVSIRAQIINLLEDLKDEFGLTILLVSHDLAVVRHTADRVAVMYLGQIVELAPVEDLYRAPAHPYTRALMAAIPAPDPKSRRERPLLEGDPPSPANPPAGCRFHTRCPFVIDRCRQEQPGLVSHDGSHKVACHRAAELAATEVIIPPAASAARLKRTALFAEASRKSISA
jgi:oligopeptide transport system ATP-binding protein